MEFASRRAGAGARVGAAVLWGLVVLAGAPACRRPPRPEPASSPAPLKGRVIDDGALPVPGARVLAVGPQSDARVPEASTAVTDADGRFLFVALPRGSYALLVEAAGMEPARLAGVALPGAEPVVKLAGLGRALEGVVLAAGVPRAGARVLLGADDGASSRETTSGPDGRFVFHGLGAGPFTLRATHANLASPAVGAGAGAKADTSAPTPPTRLELVAGFGVQGVVVDDRGRALPGVAVRAEAAVGDPVAEVMTTSGDGRFHSGPLPPGPVRLSARAPGFVAHAPVSVALGGAPTSTASSTSSSTSSRLELVRAASLAGRITDARGAALPGAEVRCVAQGGDDFAVIFAPLPLAAEAAALPSGAGGAAPGGTRLGRSDARGAFRFAELPPGAFHLEISHAPAVPLRTGDWTLVAGEARDVGALALRDGAVAAGRVLDEAGNPLSGARVLVTPSVGVFAVTDGAGGFSLRLPPGRHELVASAAGFGEARATVEVATSMAAPPAVELRLSRADARLEGLAHDTGGRPLARAAVRVRALEPSATPEATSPPAGRLLATTTTDVGGHFTLPRLPNRSLLVEVDHADYPVTFALATPGAAVDVTVPIAGGVDGEVRERGTGAVVARARVDAVGPKGQRAGADPRPSAGGSFRLKRLAPGRWTVTASAPKYRAATREVDVPASAILGDASVRGLRLELEPAR
jgi:Carboxypeptidase regulatory-like domain